MSSGWLKAGLIGLGVLVVLSLLGLIPIVAFCVVPLRWVTYIVVGVLAASYMDVPRDASKAAGQGALAGVIAAAGGGIVGLIISVIRGASGGAAQFTQVLRQLPPDVVRQLRDAGIPLGQILGSGAAGAAGVGSIAICSSVCCLGGIVFAAALGAIGAAIYASVKSD
ncbi:MAG: hypothetical protein U9Q82_13435 [Chloroflexota bacterium]|nr:hypothetical protein [Chloroflexota bacterium]